MSCVTVKYMFVSGYIAILCIPVFAMNEIVRNNDIARTTGENRSISELRFPSMYHVYGTIRIPSASINEPFEAWYAGKYNRSRIDYYEGTVKTFQRGDVGKYGTLYEIIPKYDYRHKSHYQGCWKKSGKKSKTIEAQNVLPKNVYWPFKMNLAQFKFQGTTMLNGTRCTKWVATIEVYNKTDTYTFYASDEFNPRPIRFEMQGYDIILTSYYDHYIVDYFNFTTWKYDSAIFNIPQVARRDQWCRKLPKHIGEAGYHSINPMEEFFDREGYENFKTKFKCFQNNFGKNYEHEMEHRKRMHIARHNMRYIHSMNRKHLGFQLDVNHFTDLTEEEFKNHRGTLYDDQMEMNEYERRVPIMDENFELTEKNFNQHVEEEGAPNSDGKHVIFEDKEGVGSKDEQKSNAEKTVEMDRKGISIADNKTHEIIKNDSKMHGYENLEKSLQKANYFDNAVSSKAIGSSNLSEGRYKKSEIGGKSFETEMKELVMLGEQLDELSKQLNRKNIINTTILKDGTVEKENISKKMEDISLYDRTFFKNDTNPSSKFNKWNRNDENLSRNGNGTNSVINKIINELASTNNNYNDNDTIIENPISHKGFFVNKKKIGTENSVKRQHLEISYNNDQLTKKVLVEKGKSKRRNPHVAIQKVKKRINKAKVGESLFSSVKNYQPIAEEEILDSIDKELLAQGKRNKIDNFYTPLVEVREIKDNYINMPVTSEEENNSNAKRRSFQKMYTDYNSFDKIWKKPNFANVHPFFMFGVDRRKSGENQAETLEYDFMINDDYRFPKKFKQTRKKYKHQTKQIFHQKTIKRRRKKTKIPVELDWRDYGALSPIQSQGICGSCWTFSTTAAVESAHFIKTGELAKLSEQQLLDCTWYVPHSKEGNHGCMGGWTWKSFAFIKKFGLATSKSYGKYLGMESSCKANNYSIGATIDSFMKVAPNNAKALMKAIAMYGPATASINTEAKTLKFYKNGVYNDKLCNGATDHSVLVVGYGRENGKLYWIVRNSWGTIWGSEGYIKIENGKCGLLKKPWVIINRKTRQLPWKNKINLSKLIDI